MGVCPECGLAYEAAEPSIAAAVRAFENVVPKRRRLWFTPDAECLRFPFRALVKTVATYAVLSKLFVAAEALATFIAYHLAGGTRGPMLRNLAFSTCWHRFGYDLRIDYRQLVVVLLMAFAGHMVLGLIVAGWYALAARRVHSHRRVMRRLGVFAMASLPTLLVIPMAAIAAWQALNAHFPARRGFRFVWQWLSYNRAEEHHTDWVHLLSIALIVIPGAIIGLSLYRMHREAIRQVRDALNGVVARTDRPPTR